MNKFFELSFINHIRNNDDLSLAFDKCYEPLVEKLREIALSWKIFFQTVPVMLCT